MYIGHLTFPSFYAFELVCLKILVGVGDLPSSAHGAGSGHGDFENEKVACLLVCVMLPFAKC